MSYHSYFPDQELNQDLDDNLDLDKDLDQDTKLDPDQDQDQDQELYKELDQDRESNLLHRLIILEIEPLEQNKRLNQLNHFLKFQMGKI
jgi:hypothetical protein